MTKSKKVHYQNQKEFEISIARIARAQKKVMMGYKRRYQLSTLDEQLLHRFFSPWRTPKGLTKGEIIVIVTLQDQISGLMHNRNKKIGYCAKMTRTNFVKIILELARSIA